MNSSRQEIISLIVAKLRTNKESLKKQFSATKDSIGYFYLDDLLPEKLTLKIYENFPSLSNAELKKDIREYKYVAYQMNKYHPLLEEVIYAFQDDTIVSLISEICQVKDILPDNNLYAGGLSLMKKGNFLNPHLDNSHDKDRDLWRVFNLLFYVSPNWEIENGGNLELWSKGLRESQIIIESKFNRLVVMATHQNSWHSVSRVKANKVRCCVSNYYFSKSPLLFEDKFHVTTFRGRPKEKLKDFVLQLDNKVRSTLRLFFKKGVIENPHQYKK